MTGWIVLGLLFVAIALASLRYGADTRTTTVRATSLGEPVAPPRQASLRADLTQVWRRLASGV
jgi:hypothetical protein